jgi:hypothetical protein
MHYELSVLRALLRLARRRASADIDQLLVRVGGVPADLRDALRRLEKAGLVERLPHGGFAGAGEAAGRLTLSGLAVAVASVANRGGRADRADRAGRSASVGAKSSSAKVFRGARQKPRAA